jgi:dTDP-glucose pyrophosphorylase
MTEGSAVVLAAGKIDYRHLPVGTNLSNAMIPVNGRPVAGWILEDLLAKGIGSATFVLRREDERLKQFLRWAYAGRMEIRTAEVEGDGTILDSVAAGLAVTSVEGPLRLVLGDTLIRDSFESERDFLYVGRAEGARRWCLAVTDAEGRVVDYRDKSADDELAEPALAGYYHLHDRDRVRAALGEARRAGERELSAFLRRYGKGREVWAHAAKDWLDFGHIDNLVEARRRLLAPRSFNALSIDPLLSTITKSSENNEKLEDELTWYLELPERLKVLAPRVLSHRRRNGRLEIVQEYYGYPSLAELYVFGEMGPDFWASVLRRLFAILGEFRRHPGELDPRHVEEMYLGKTFRRLEALRSDPWWHRLLGRKSVCLNGRDLPTPFAVRRQLEEECHRLAVTAKIAITHGDFCFSNILFDINTQVVRLIDPRGRFGVRGVDGDIRYDVAKLRHSVAGLYDYVVADLFTLEEESEGVFRTEICRNGERARTIHLFDRLLEDAGYSLQDVRLIEALLFLSMVPLHADRPRRQKMMFLVGLERLQEWLSR